MKRRAPPYSCSYLRFVRAGVVGWTDGRDFFENPIGFRECPHAGFAVRKSFFEHLLRVEPKEDIEQFVRISTVQSAGEYDGALRA